MEVTDDKLVWYFSHQYELWYQKLTEHDKYDNLSNWKHWWIPATRTKIVAGIADLNTDLDGPYQIEVGDIIRLKPNNDIMWRWANFPMRDISTLFNIDLQVKEENGPFLRFIHGNITYLVPYICVDLLSKVNLHKNAVRRLRMV